jgi:hypothetical protein
MKQTAINQAILMVRNRIDSQIDTMMGKHTAHHLQQIERILYNLIEEEKRQIENAFDKGVCEGFDYATIKDSLINDNGQQYYQETYKKK